MAGERGGGPDCQRGWPLCTAALTLCCGHVPLLCFPAGCVEFLDQPTMAFVRLQEAAQLDAVLEVPIPVRFLFVLLGPSSTNMDYHEIGRSISTLMSDKVGCLVPSLAGRPAPGLPPSSSRCSLSSSLPQPPSNSMKRPTWLTTGRTC